jgi:hypothetical protein
LDTTNFPSCTNVPFSCNACNYQLCHLIVPFVGRSHDIYLTRGRGEWVVKLIFLFLDKERKHFKIGKCLSICLRGLQDCLQDYDGILIANGEVDWK